MADLDLRPHSGSGRWIGACGVVAVGLGIAERNAALIAFGLALVVGTITLFVWLRRSFGGIRVERQMPESAYEGDTVDVDITLRNESAVPVFFPYLEEVFHPEVHSQRRLLFPGHMRPGEEVELPYAGHCVAPRGVYGVGPAALMISDPFGLFRRTSSLTNAGGIKVYPPLVETEVREQIGHFISTLTEQEGVSGRGRSDEFFKVREYIPGDSHRLIHWRLTAHLGYPVVREYSRTSGGGLTLFFDAHEDAVIGRGRNSSFEAAVKIIAGLAERALSRGRSVQVFTAGVKERDVLQTVSTSLEYRRLLDALLYVAPDPGRRPFVDLLGRSAHRMARETTIVVTVSPYLYDDPQLASQLLEWKLRGHRVLALVFGEFVDLRGRQAEANLAEAQRYARRSMASGIRTILFSCGTRLRPVAPTWRP